MVTGPSMPPTTPEVPWMNSWNISKMEHWTGNSIKVVQTRNFICYHLKIFPIFKYFCESPLAVQMLVNNEECDLKSLALCKCLLLITVAITASCTSWLRKKHMLWCHKCCISQTTLLRVPWHRNQSSTAMSCARKKAVQKQTCSCRPGEDTEGKEQLGNRRRFGIWNWAWGYRWAFSETLRSLDWLCWIFSPLLRTKKNQPSWWQFNTHIP